MFGKENKLIHHHIVNIIQHHTVINGDIHCQGDLRLDGTVIGNVKVIGRLVVGQEAKIEGNIECENADISGKIKGVINVKETLHLKKHCIIDGDIYTKKLMVEGDAIFNGKCIMKKNENTYSLNEKHEKNKVAPV